MVHSIDFDRLTAKIQHPKDYTYTDEQFIDKILSLACIPSDSVVVEYTKFTILDTVAKNPDALKIGGLKHVILPPLAEKYNKLGPTIQGIWRYHMELAADYERRFWGKLPQYDTYKFWSRYANGVLWFVRKVCSILDEYHMFVNEHKDDADGG